VASKVIDRLDYDLVMNYKFEGKDWIGEVERDLIIYKVAWKLWVNEDMKDSYNLLMRIHYEALRIIENIAFKMEYKEEKNDPTLKEEMLVVNLVARVNWFYKLSRYATRNWGSL
jgi:hypothetical protein